MRPVLFLPNAYLPERYKNRTGTMRKVFVRIWGLYTIQRIPYLIFRGHQSHILH